MVREELEARPTTDVIFSMRFLAQAAEGSTQHVHVAPAALPFHDMILIFSRITMTYFLTSFGTSRELSPQALTLLSDIPSQETTRQLFLYYNRQDKI